MGGLLLRPPFKIPTAFIDFFFNSVCPNVDNLEVLVGLRNTLMAFLLHRYYKSLRKHFCLTVLIIENLLLKLILRENIK